MKMIIIMSYAQKASKKAKHNGRLIKVEMFNGSFTYSSSIKAALK